MWLAQGGRKILKIMRLQLVIHSIMHGTTLTLTKLDSVSVFQLAGKAKHKKKSWCDFEAINVSYIVCIKRNATRFSTAQAKTNSFNKKGKQQASSHHKMGITQNSNKKHEYKSHFLH